MPAVTKVLQTVSEDTEYQLDYSALIAAGYVVPEAEVAAQEDYLFDQASAEVLRNRLDGYLLTQGPLAVLAPVFNSNYATLDSEYGGLIAKTADQTSMTVAAVFQRPTGTVDSALQIIGSETGPGVNTGFGILTSDVGFITLSIRPGTGDPSIISAVAGPALAKGEWGFVAGVVGDGTASVYLGNAGSLLSSSATGLTRTIAGNINIGKVLAVGSGYGATDLNIHRAAIFGRELSETEVLGLYKRMQVVAARRGITVN